MDVSRYLRRIRYTGRCDVGPHLLRELHRLHMFSVPFENLDIHLGTRITLDLSSIYEKIVGRNRGGFCYELNGLFGGLLETLGFEVDLLSGRMFDGKEPEPEFDHLVLLVRSDEDWLADVGSGGFFLEPLHLNDSGVQKQGRSSYRLERSGEDITVLERIGEARWKPLYVFSLIPRSLDEFVPMCERQQTSPESIFARKRMCTMVTPSGRVTLSDMSLIVTDGGDRSEREIRDIEEYSRHLWVHFGIDLPNIRWVNPLAKE